MHRDALATDQAVDSTVAGHGATPS